MSRSVLPARILGGASTVALCLGLSVAAPAPVDAQTPGSFPQGFEEMVAEQLPAVVGILATRPAPDTASTVAPQLPPGLEEFFGQAPGTVPPPGAAPPPGPLRAAGSGFIVSADGFVVTNNHVIAGSETVEVVLEDERRFDAEIVGADPATDIALLKVTADEDLPVVDWGDSEELRIGQWVVAIGNPFGLGGTVTAGILSARSRDINAGPYDDFLQTDAAINSGNSGGPLFNAGGEVIGVNTAIFSPSGGNVGIGFAVPSQVARNVVEDLRDDGVVERGYLGVQIQPVSADLAEALGLETEGDETAPGALVANVTEGGPAAEAGLEAGDVVTAVAGTEIATPRDLTFEVAELEVGETVSLTIVRDGETQELDVEIGAQPATLFGAAAEPEAEAEAEAGPMLGVTVAPVTAELRATLGLPDDLEGLAISSVAPGSAAADAGLRPRDVIAEAAGEPVRAVEDLRAAAAEAEGDGRPLLLRVWSRGSYGFRAVSFAPGAD
ncbi:Do family serine endopeptidase [Histidinibacterium lentulum]|uniref:Probable periplasmic serine endoprotease DegP-like n=1 Tax=Histidinibacterium lentulum TaxID=2480588 RepID=A0A3N2R8G6_9RHOB|nr:Do family serine endopeptidase [Histidinibacterium lentulum]ROU03754.1 Do family serine endopeptidase [Histidinibacterium lentulum]